MMNIEALGQLESVACEPGVIMTSKLLRALVFGSLLCFSSIATPMPPIKTVFVILMENCPWRFIQDSTNAPFINHILLPQSSYCDQYYNPSNFVNSLISYLWLEGGTNFGLLNGDPNAYNPPSIFHISTTDHLVTYLNRSGISWKAYQESIAGDVVPLNDWDGYVVRHDPFVYFDDVTGTNNPYDPYGLAHIRPYSELAADLTNQAVAQYNFITPNVCNDMHNVCSPLTNNILQGDTWLAQEVPRIMASSAYNDRGALFISWDDNGGWGGPIGMIVLSPLARGHGYASTNFYTHSSLLRTVQEIFGVTPLLRDAATANNLAELFAPGFKITSITSANGSTLLTITGVRTNAPLVLENSHDLISWSPLSTNSPATEIQSLTVPTPSDASLHQNFYRFVQPAP
jgi:phosphatidylinositol-3-phosphatase